MFLDIIKKRRSIRKYKDMPISEGDLFYILEAGRLAPSGGNEQPWLFGVVNDKKIINELVKCCRNQKWIASAPVVIALCTKRFEERDMDKAESCLSFLQAVKMLGRQIKMHSVHL